MSVGFMGVDERKKQMQQSNQMTLQGFEAYNKAVLEMVRGLKDPKRSKNDGIIVAARILQFYEVWTAALGRSTRSWELTALPPTCSYFLEKHPTGAPISRASWLSLWPEARNLLYLVNRTSYMSTVES